MASSSIHEYTDIRIPPQLIVDAGRQALALRLTGKANILSYMIKRNKARQHGEKNGVQEMVGRDDDLRGERRHRANRPARGRAGERAPPRLRPAAADARLGAQEDALCGLQGPQPTV